MKTENDYQEWVKITAKISIVCVVGSATVAAIAGAIYAVAITVRFIAQ